MKMRPFPFGSSVLCPELSDERELLWDAALEPAPHDRAAQLVVSVGDVLYESSGPSESAR